MQKFRYVKLAYKYIISNWPIAHFAELDENGFEVRTIDVYDDNSYGYANKYVEHNAILSECAFPTVSEFYTSGEFDLNEADYYDITKSEFEKEWIKAVNSFQR